MKALVAGGRAAEVAAGRLTVREVADVPPPSEYGPAAVVALRRRVGVSRAVFARLLGASPYLVQSWEQGKRQPAPIVRRLLDEVKREPARWAGILRTAGDA